MSEASVIDYAVTAAVLGAIALLLFRFIRQGISKTKAKECQGCGQSGDCANSLASRDKPPPQPPGPPLL